MLDFPIARFWVERKMKRECNSSSVLTIHNTFSLSSSKKINLTLKRRCIWKKNGWENAKSFSKRCRKTTVGKQYWILAKVYVERAVRRVRASESLVLIIYNDVSTINFDANTVYCMSNDTFWCFKITNAIILFRRFSTVLHKKARFPGIQSAFCVRREFLRMSSYVFECLAIYRYFWRRI